MGKVYGKGRKKTRTLQDSVDLSPTKHADGSDGTTDPMSSPRKREATPSPKTNKFFIESKHKPTWSPSLSPRNSPRKVLDLGEVSASPASRVLRSLSSPKPPRSSRTSDASIVSPSQSTEAGCSVWDMLEDIEKPKKSTLKISLRSPKKVNRENHRQLEEFYRDMEKEDASTPVPSIPASPRLIRSKKNYGMQRSLLMEREEQHETQHHEELEAQPKTSEDNDNQVKSFTDLWAQGSNAQYSDDLIFLLEGINEKLSLAGLLDLALKLMERPFLKYTKAHGGVDFVLDSDDPSISYVYGYIVLVLDLRVDVKAIVKTLLTKKVEPKASKLTNSLFQEWREKVGSMSPSHLAVSLLVKDMTVDDELLALCVELMGGYEDDLLLVLFEHYLNTLDFAPMLFGKVVNQLLKDQSVTDNVLALKLLIVLGMKKEYIYHPQLTERAIRSASKSDNEIQVLCIGLLIKLVEDGDCMQTCCSHMDELQLLYSKVGDESIGYFSLLIGTIHTNFPNVVRSAFHRKELEGITLELHKLKAQGAMRQQVEDVLQSMS